MAYVVPSVLSGFTYAGQSVADSVDLQTPGAYAAQSTGVVSGCTVSPHSGGAYSVDVAAGRIAYQGTEYAISAASGLAPAAASPTDRRDIVVAQTSGTFEIIEGTPMVGSGAWFPGCGFNAAEKPAIPANTVIVGELFIPAGYSGNVVSAMLTDKTLAWISPTSTNQGTTDIEAIPPNSQTSLTGPIVANSNKAFSGSAFGTVKGDPFVFGQAGTLLAAQYYEPGAGTVKSTTSTSLVAIDTTNLTVSFTATTTVAVVQLEALVGDFSGSSSEALFWALFTHSTTSQVGYTTEAANSNSNGIATRVVATIRVTGLTVGTSYQYDWAWAASAATDTWFMGINAIAGSTSSPYGPAIMRVFAG